jgi:hypothetical protein
VKLRALLVKLPAWESVTLPGRCLIATLIASL